MFMELDVIWYIRSKISLKFLIKTFAAIYFTISRVGRISIRFFYIHLHIYYIFHDQISLSFRSNYSELFIFSNYGRIFWIIYEIFPLRPFKVNLLTKHTRLLHTHKSFRNLVNLNKIWILITLFQWI